MLLKLSRCWLNLIGQIIGHQFTGFVYCSSVMQDNNKTAPVLIPMCLSISLFLILMTILQYPSYLSGVYVFLLINCHLHGNFMTKSFCKSLLYNLTTEQTLLTWSSLTCDWANIKSKSVWVTQSSYLPLLLVLSLIYLT